MLSTDSTVRPFRIAIAEADLADLHDRLDRTRWPDAVPGTGPERGLPVAELRALAERWRAGYDWRAAEAALNAIPQFTTVIDGQTVHFAHFRSPEPDATPLLLVHGWPSTFAEFAAAIGPLVNPRAHGGDPVDAFDVVVPSLPGHGFSVPLAGAGWTVGRIAAAFHELMGRLGYDRYGVQGGDWGASVVPEMARLVPDAVVGVHVNALVTFPSEDPADVDGLTEAEQARLARLQAFQDDGMGFVAIQSTRPQTLAYALTDSPVGQLAWIAEKVLVWSDPEVQVHPDALLTTASLYWFTRTAGPSAHLYYEGMHDPSAWAPKTPSGVPTAVLVSESQDVAIRRFAERDHRVVRWTEAGRGGHFFAAENPDAFVDDLRAFFRTLR